MFVGPVQPNAWPLAARPGVGANALASMSAGSVGSPALLSQGMSGMLPQGSNSFAPSGKGELMSAMMGLMGMMLQLLSSMMGGLSQPGLMNPAAPSPVDGNAPDLGETASPSAASAESSNPNPASQTPVANTPASGASPARGTWTRPNQMEVFDPSVRNSACGPAAAIGLAKSMGIDVSPQQALQLAGGNFSQNGMGQSQVAKLANDMGVPAYNEEGAINWDKVKSEAAQGKKVVLHFEGHYYFVEGYDPATGKFDLGTSVTQFRGVPKDANGRPISQYTQDEIKNLLIPALSSTLPSLTTQERGAIYIR